MGKLDFPVEAPGLFHAGMLNIIKLMKRRKFIVDNIFSSYFVSQALDNKAGWDNVRRVMESFSDAKAILTGATPSTPKTSSDIMFTPFSIRKSGRTFSGMYEKALSYSILLSGAQEDGDFSLWIPFDTSGYEEESQEAFNRWSSLLHAYENLYEMEKEAELIFSTLKPLYLQGNTAAVSGGVASFFATFSPAQLMFIGGGEGMTGHVFAHKKTYYYGNEYSNHLNGVFPFGNETSYFGDPSPENFATVATYIPQFFADISWTCLSEIFGDILNAMLGGDIRDLWYVDIPTLEYGTSEQTFPVSWDSKFITLTPPASSHVFGVTLDHESTSISFDASGNRPPQLVLASSGNRYSVGGFRPMSDDFTTIAVSAVSSSNTVAASSLPIMSIKVKYKYLRKL